MRCWQFSIHRKMICIEFVFFFFVINNLLYIRSGKILERKYTVTLCLIRSLQFDWLTLNIREFKRMKDWNDGVYLWRWFVYLLCESMGIGYLTDSHSISDEMSTSREKDWNCFWESKISSTILICSVQTSHDSGRFFSWKVEWSWLYVNFEILLLIFE